MTDVCLVSMPYSAIERPSIALGILQACLRKVDIDVETLYGNLLFAEQIGLDKYAVIDFSRNEDLLGEWTFSGSAFPEFHPDHRAFLAMASNKSSALSRVLWDIRAQAGLFIERLADRIIEMQPRMVGCTSTFQQNCASLALLRRIKALSPNIITMMGGANCESIMGVTLRRNFPWVDYVVSGEADELIGDLCHMLLEHGNTPPDPAQMPFGVIGATPRRSSRTLNIVRAVEPPRAIVKKLDNSPVPDYSDYFATLAHSSLRHVITPGLLIETSRGCWWGQKHHCTFCGLNGLGLGYRSKSPDRVVQELEELADNYGIRKVMAVDDILNMGFLDTVLLKISTLEDKYALFFETKANLKRTQLQRLADAGITWIQPGIEGLHDEFLKLIDKGTTAFINLQLMKWCREYGIYVTWNLLTGAPGESDAWFAEMNAWLPLIAHFSPPQGAIKIRFDRFSPYFTQAEEYGIRLTPLKGYSYVYPLAGSELFDLSYFFEDGNDEDARLAGVDEKQARPALHHFKLYIDEWEKSFRNGSPPVLSMLDSGDSLRITDTRPCAIQPIYILEGLAREVYHACDEAITAEGLVNALQDVQPGILWEEDIAPVIDQLKRRKLLLELGNKFFSLAIRENSPALPNVMDFPGGNFDVNAFVYNNYSPA